MEAALPFKQISNSYAYRNRDIDNPTPTQRILNFTIFDGSLDSTFAQTTLDVVAVNDAPVIDLDVE